MQASDSNKCNERWQQLWWAKMRMVVMVMRVVGNKYGEGGMAMAMMKRMAGKQQQWQQRGQ